MSSSTLSVPGLPKFLWCGRHSHTFVDLIQQELGSVWGLIFQSSCWLLYPLLCSSHTQKLLAFLARVSEENKCLPPLLSSTVYLNKINLIFPKIVSAPVHEKRNICDNNVFITSVVEQLRSLVFHFSFSILLSMYGCLACMYVCAPVRAWYAQRLEKWSRSPGTGVAGGCKPPFGNQPISLARAASALNAAPSL